MDGRGSLSYPEAPEHAESATEHQSGCKSSDRGGRFLPLPVLVALGHATDDLVVARVADASFPTPTALGAWLRQTVEAKRVWLLLGR
ncbi:MAG TPA: hypothetical protein VEL76_05035 [Gemmataceae bacterium]|nr:hypothetical protein [Gemmataceae bacterium]